jgi:hypothetical protein
MLLSSMLKCFIKINSLKNLLKYLNNYCWLKKNILKMILIILKLLKLIIIWGKYFKNFFFFFFLLNIYKFFINKHNKFLFLLKNSFILKIYFTSNFQFSFQFYLIFFFFSIDPFNVILENTIKLLRIWSWQ